VGKPITTEDVSTTQDLSSPILYGARISQSNRKNYTIGVSALKSESTENSRLREEEGLDLWLRPHELVDINGRSTYNSVTDGWMEHNYAVSSTPIKDLNLGVDFSHVNFKDYLYNLTTQALNINNPLWNYNHKQTVYGGSAAYSGIKNLTLAADGKYYLYDKSGNAAYYGGKVSYKFPAELLVGGGLHRMAGDIDRLCYTEIRAYVTKKIGRADLTLDALDVNYKKSINGVSNSIAVTGAAGFEFNRKLKIRGDLQYSKNPDFDKEVRALVMATYTFDSKFAAEGGTKSEK
jgi:hypothetical protein